jgi:quinol-cytochrome oxidoreductase complex cytochrome b subunit
MLASLAALLLALVGYAAGVALKSGKSGIRKPVILDVLIVALMWGGAVVSRSLLPVSRWLQLPAWIIIGLVLGYLMTLAMAFSRGKHSTTPELKSETAAVPKKKKLRAWRDFSSKIGTFQSQILLGLLFLIVFAPVALAVKIFSDPLRIKGRGQGSHWSPKTEIPPDFELFKRQS